MLENELHDYDVVVASDKANVESTDKDSSEQPIANAVSEITDKKNSDASALDSLDIDTLHEDDIELLRHSIDSSINELMSSFFLHSKLDLPPSKIRDAFSSLLGYGFHFMDRPKVPRHHSFKKSYFAALREAFYA